MTRTREVEAGEKQKYLTWRTKGETMRASFEVGYVPSALPDHRHFEFSDSAPPRTTNYSVIVLRNCGTRDPSCEPQRHKPKKGGQRACPGCDWPGRKQFRSPHDGLPPGVSVVPRPPKLRGWRDRNC